MTPKEKSEQLIAEFKNLLQDEDTECGNEILCTILSVKFARLTVRNILAANPHTNPYNNNFISTFDYWFEVYNELNKDL
jgi:hypothetical protein